MKKIKNSQASISMNSCAELPLCLRGKLGTSKTNFWDKILKKPRFFAFSSGKQTIKTASLASIVHFETFLKLQQNGSAVLSYAIIFAVQTTGTDDKIKYYRLSKTTETKQENTKENTS